MGMETPAPNRQTRRSAGRLTFTQCPAIIELAVPARVRQSGGLRRMHTLNVTEFSFTVPGTATRLDASLAHFATKTCDTISVQVRCSLAFRLAIIRMMFRAEILSASFVAQTSDNACAERCSDDRIHHLASQSDGLY